MTRHFCTLYIQSFPAAWLVSGLHRVQDICTCMHKHNLASLNDSNRRLSISSSRSLGVRCSHPLIRRECLSPSSGVPFRRCIIRHLNVGHLNMIFLLHFPFVFLGLITNHIFVSFLFPGSHPFTASLSTPEARNTFRWIYIQDPLAFCWRETHCFYSLRGRASRGLSNIPHCILQHINNYMPFSL